MEDIDGGLHPAVDGQSLDDEEQDEKGKLKCTLVPSTAVWNPVAEEERKKGN